MGFLQPLISRLSRGGHTPGGRRLSAPTPQPISAEELAALKPDWLIIGLGNPGAEYAHTRHNVGYMAIDRLAELHCGGRAELDRPDEETARGAECTWQEARAGVGADNPTTNTTEQHEPRPEWRPVTGIPASAIILRHGGGTALLIRAHTYMNLSGEAIAPLARTTGIPAKRIIALHDELDLPAGTTRIKQGGGENGHNGLKSLSAELGTRDYVRIRMGIGRPPAGTAVPDYVLSPIGALSDEWLRPLIRDASDGVVEILAGGVGRAQNVIHVRR